MSNESIALLEIALQLHIVDETTPVNAFLKLPVPPKDDAGVLALVPQIKERISRLQRLCYNAPV